MGRFVNPDNSAFQLALNSEIYVDKTELLAYTNKVMNTNHALICNSRPRRFGKSITANMLSAYYSKGCSSADMFDNLEISKTADYKKHLNQYDVIHLDIQWCSMDAESPKQTVAYINANVTSELKKIYPQYVPNSVTNVCEAMSYINKCSGKKFIIIIDEWDVLIRDESYDTTVQDEYINFLRGIFNENEPTQFLHLVFMTGILPIPKIKTRSVLNHFNEYTMLNAKIFALYMGFTEKEVRRLCIRYNRDFSEVKRWYDGYLLSGMKIYNPKAIVDIMTWGDFQSYWSQTGTYESIVPLINMNFDGLNTAVIDMIAGSPVRINPETFQNDMVSLKNKDDVLTLLIHLGYLAYNSLNKTTFIPNEDIRQELIDTVEDTLKLSDCNFPKPDYMS